MYFIAAREKLQISKNYKFWKMTRNIKGLGHSCSILYIVTIRRFATCVWYIQEWTAGETTPEELHTDGDETSGRNCFKYGKQARTSELKIKTLGVTT